MVLELSGVSKSYGKDGPRVLDHIDLTIAAGQTCALTGESGSGKSTLLHLAAALDTADSGTITVQGQDLGGLSDAERARIRRDTVSVVFQQFNLIPSLTVEKNLTFHARLAGNPDPAWEAELFERLDLSQLKDRYPEQLSGGQQQRVAIGRALAARPALVLADEPTGNLDEETADAVMALFLELVDRTGAALLMATHSTRLSRKLQQVQYLSRGRLT